VVPAALALLASFAFDLFPETTTPLSAVALVFVAEVGLGGRDEFGELRAVLRSYVLQSKDGSLLLVYNRSETGLVLDNHVRDTHLAAERWDEDDELDRVDIVSDDDEVGLLVLDEGNTVVKTHLDEHGLLSILLWLLSLVGSDSLSLFVETALLLLLCLGSVLVEETEELGSSVLVEGVAELSDRRWDLEALVEDDTLSLETNVLGPLDESGQVTSRLDVLANAEVLWLLLEERVGDLL